MVVVDHVPTTACGTEAYTGLPISMPLPKQFGSASRQGLETQLTVSDYGVLTVVVANY